MPKVSVIPWIIKKLKGTIGIVEDTDTATHAISIGKYVIWKGVLCKTSVAIAVNDTLSTGSGGNLTVVDNGGLNDVNGNIPAIVDNLTTNDNTKTLSASQGYALNNKITNLDGSIPYAEGNANNYTTTGIYHVGLTQNSPTGSTIYGDLFVQGTGQRVTQMMTIYDGTTYVRQRINATTWNAWDAFALSSKLSKIGTTYEDTKLTNGSDGTLTLSVQKGKYLILYGGHTQANSGTTAYISIGDGSAGIWTSDKVAVTPMSTSSKFNAAEQSAFKTYSQDTTITITYDANWYYVYARAILIANV